MKILLALVCLLLAFTIAAKTPPTPPGTITVVSTAQRNGVTYERLVIDGQECLQARAQAGTFSDSVALTCDWKQP